MKEIKCPNCQSEEKWKYGHFRGKQRYICKKCRRTFTAGSSRRFPPTSLPFEFVSFILYQHKKESLGKTAKYVNHWLEIFKIKGVPICKKEKITRTTIYNWRKKYGKKYANLVDKNEAITFFQNQIRKAYPTNNKQILEREMKIIEKKLPHLEGLKYFRDCMGGTEYCLQIAREYPKVFNMLIEDFKKYQMLKEGGMTIEYPHKTPFFDSE